MASDDTALWIAGGLGLYLLTRKPAPPEPVVGPARVSGGLTAINVSGQNRGFGLFSSARATMGAPVDKIGLQIVYTRVAVSLTTKDAAGADIMWPYNLVMQVGHTVGLGWDTIEETDLPAARKGGPGHRSVVFTAQGNQLINFPVFLAPDDLGKEWDVRVWLLALKSDIYGNPVGESALIIPLGTKMKSSGWQGWSPDDNWYAIAYRDLPGAFRIIQRRSAQITGAIATITVSQANLGQCPHRASCGYGG